MIINVNGYRKKDKKVKGSAVGGGEDYIVLKTDQQRLIKEETFVQRQGDEEQVMWARKKPF